MDFSDALQLVTGEVADTLGAVACRDAEELADLIGKSRRVFVCGQGRSGLVARAFGMRLTHLGLTVHVAGETTAGAIGRGDLFVAVSCSGSTDITCLTASKAKAAGATCVGVVGRRRCRLARLSGHTLVVPTPSKARKRSGESAQFGSSLFEQCSLLLLDALCLMLGRRLKQSHARMLARHSNLE